MKLLILTILLPLFVHASLNNVDKAFIYPENQLDNPAFQNGKAKWSVSTGSFSIAGSGLDNYASWDASATDQTFCTALKAVPTRLFGQNGFAMVRTVVPSGTATHHVYVTDGTDIISSEVDVTSSDTIQETGVTFIFPDSGSLQLCLESQADEPAIRAYSGYLGENYNVGTVAQAEFVGSAVWTGAASCEWQTTSTTFAAFAADTDCNDPTVEGDIAAPSTKTLALASPTGTWQPGKYEFSINMNTFNVATAQIYAYRVSTGTVHSTEWMSITRDASTSDYESGQMVYAMTLNSPYSGQMTLQCKTSTGTFRVINVAGQTLTWLTKRYPLSSETVVKADQTDRPWTAYTPTFTGFGTVSVQSFFWRRVGENLEILGKFTSGTSTATEARIGFPGSIVSNTTAVPSIRKVGSATQTVAIAGNFHVLAESGLGYFTLGYETGSEAGLTKTNANAIIASGTEMSVIATVPIQGWTHTMNAPLVKQSVVTSSDGVTGIEAAFVADGSATTTVTEKTGDWLNGNCTNPSAGVYVCTMNAGIFSTAPACFVTMYTGSGGNCYISSASAISTTNVQIQCVNTSFSAADSDFFLQCVGPR